MIGKRLNLARSSAGLSRCALEARIGRLVTAPEIGKYERDESMPSSGALIAMAKALGVSVEYLTGDPDLVLATAAEQRPVPAGVAELLERYLALEELLALPSDEWDIPPGAPYPAAGDPAAAELAAFRLRAHWGLGRNPIPSMVELLEANGIKVIAFDLGAGDGLTAYARRGGIRRLASAIVVNRGHSGERQRFTLARELGRLVLAVDAGVGPEKAAHRFAGAFLMPAASLRRAIGSRRTSIGRNELLSLKRRFGVSVQELVRRCRDLGIIDDALFGTLYRDMSGFGWGSLPYAEPEPLAPEPLAPERPSRFERLCSRAVAENVISDAKAAELLGTSVRELTTRRRRRRGVRGASTGRMAQLMMMAACRAARWPALRRALPRLAELARRGAREQVRMFVLYVLATQEEQMRRRFAREFQRQVPGPRGDTMNYVEEIKRESRQEGLMAGRVEGRQEGRVEGQVRTIEGLLRAGAAWPLIESATGIDEDGLRALKQRLTASSAGNGAADAE